MATTAYRKKRAFPRLQRRNGAPVYYAYMEGPRRTFAGDSGDVADVCRNTPAGGRGGGITWADGRRGKCLKCAGSGYVTLGNAALLNPRGPFTVAVGVNFTVVPAGTNDMILFGRDDNVLGRSLALGVVAFSGRGLSVQVNGADSLHASDLGSYVAGRWYRLVATGSPAAGLALYRDGAQVGTGAWAAPAATTGATTLAGRTYSGAQNYLNGYLDDVQVFNRALSASEVARDAADPDYWTRPRRRVATFALAPAPASRAAALLMMGP